MVIDASIAFKLMVEEPGSDEAIAWVGRTELVAPTLIHAEVGNALWKRVQRGELVGDGVAERLADFAQVISTRDETFLMPRAVGIAIELAHPVYDCVYLALAEALDDDLLTADIRLAAAVRGTPFEPRLKQLGA